MAITYDAPSNTITATGFSEVTPGELEDIYNADVAGGWGRSTMQGNSNIASFTFNCRLKIGDGSTATWFKDTRKVLFFLHGILTAHSTDLFLVKDNAHYDFGEVQTEVTKISKNGCVIIFGDETYSSDFDGEVGSECNLYSCTFIAYSFSTIRYPTRFWNCTVNGQFTSLIGNPDADISRVTSVNTGSGMRISAAGISVAGIRGIGTARLFHSENFPSGYNLDVSDCWGIGNTYFCEGAAPSVGYRIRCIDFDTNATDNGGSHAGYVYKAASFNLTVLGINNTPLQNAEVTLKDKNNTGFTDVLTDVNGILPEQIVNYHQHLSPVGGETLSPFTLLIERSGYETYEETFTFPVWTKINWVIALQPLIPRTAISIEHTINDLNIDVTVENLDITVEV